MINIVIALACEAKSLIQHYNLQLQSSESGFRIYQNQDMHLIVCGVGKTSVAAACDHLHSLNKQYEAAAWLNVGIAGQRDLALGSPVVAHKITDAASQQYWFPTLLFKPPCDTLEIITVDEPIQQYSGHYVYDMEASAFYITANRYAPSELVHSLKIISDNQHESTDKINAKLVRKLMQQGLQQIDYMIQQLQTLSRTFAGIKALPLDYERCLRYWHFSTYQQHQLKRLLQRWQALRNTGPWCDALALQDDSRQVLYWLQQQLLTMPLQLGQQEPA